MRHREQVRRDNEARLGLLAREFMIGAFSAVAGDAVARQVHEDGPIEHFAHQMGLEIGPNLLFPLAFLIVVIVIRVPMVVRRCIRRKLHHRRIHHVRRA